MGNLAVLFLSFLSFPPSLFFFPLFFSLSFFLRRKKKKQHVILFYLRNGAVELQVLSGWQLWYHRYFRSSTQNSVLKSITCLCLS